MIEEDNKKRRFHKKKIYQNNNNKFICAIVFIKNNQINEYYMLNSNTENANFSILITYDIETYNSET